MRSALSILSGDLDVEGFQGTDCWARALLEVSICTFSRIYISADQIQCQQYLHTPQPSP